MGCFPNPYVQGKVHCCMKETEKLCASSKDIVCIPFDSVCCNDGSYVSRNLICSTIQD